MKKTKKTKRKIYLILILLICSIAIMTISAIKLLQTKENIANNSIPASGLTNSVFDKQNNEYETPKEKCTQYYILNGHYSYDMDLSQKADVGSSSFFDIKEYLKIGVTYTQESDVISILATDLKEGFNVDNIKIINQEKGYRNGWESTYYVLSGKEASSSTPIKIIAYTGKVDEGTFIVSAFSGTLTYEQLASSCRKTYDSIHVPDEWKRVNETETTKLFQNVDETTSDENAY